MLNVKNLITALVISTAISSPMALAEKIPMNGSADSRIKTVSYNANDVVNVTAHYGFSSMIEFGVGEEILTISIGDTVAWTYLETENRLFLKPVEEKANTNMQVVTSKRVYNFALVAKKAQSHRSSDLTFTLKFRYPQDKLAAQQLRLAQKEAQRNHPSLVVPEHSFKASDVNMEYTRKGSELIAPRRVFDDGEFTYFAFNETVPTPAIFAVDSEKNETLVNFHKKGKYIVVQRLAAQFTLRHGNDVTCVFNKSFLPNLAESMVDQEDSSSSNDHDHDDEV